MIFLMNNLRKKFSNLEEIKNYVEEFEERGYKIIERGNFVFIKTPVGETFSESYLETLVINQKLECCNKEHIGAMKAYNFLMLSELKLEGEYNEWVLNEFRKFDKANIVLENSKDKEEISEAQKIINRFESAFDEGLFAM